MRILTSPHLYLAWNNYAEQCLLKFVAEFGDIYGWHHLVFNVHSLVHLAADCRLHGPLDSFSSFPHESFLGKMKRLIRSKNRPLAQLIRR